jgi:hypothetical protein
MPNNNVPAGRDDGRIARLILMGPVGNYIYERCTKTDFDRQAEAIQRMRDNGMEHGEAEMSSKHKRKIHTDKGDFIITEQNDGVYRW